MDESVQLKLIGITYNQIESGVYALILEDTVLKRRLAIVIGYPEAQSIECRLQNVKTPRPLTHDLTTTLIKELGSTLLRVDIHRLPSGPYAGTLTLLTKNGEKLWIDARSSDAIALAIRVGAPIFTSRELLEKEGFTPKTNLGKETIVQKLKIKKYSKYSLDELQNLLNDLVAKENYEEAAKVKEEIDQRYNKGEIQ